MTETFRAGTDLFDLTGRVAIVTGASIVTYLLSDASRFVACQPVAVDGGYPIS
jgi:hypothetical protein